MRLVLVVPFLVACGSAASPSPAGPASETPAPSVPSAALGHPLPSDAMVQGWLTQMVLDHPRVVPFLHSEARDRLRVHAISELAEGARGLRVAGRPVELVEASAAHFRFTARERPSPAVERIRFEMPGEGMSGHVDFALRDHTWTAIDAEVAEH